MCEAHVTGRKIEDPEDTPRINTGLRDLLRDSTRPSSDEETKRECPVPNCKGGRVRLEHETGSTYSVLEETCATCHGLGMVSAAEWREWMGKS